MFTFHLLIIWTQAWDYQNEPNSSKRLVIFPFISNLHFIRTKLFNSKISNQISTAAAHRSKPFGPILSDPVSFSSTRRKQKHCKKFNMTITLPTLETSFFTLFRPFFHVFLNFVFRFFVVSFVLCPSPVPLFDILTWAWLQVCDVIVDDDVRSCRHFFEM